MSTTTSNWLKIILERKMKRVPKILSLLGYIEEEYDLMFPNKEMFAEELAKIAYEGEQPNRKTIVGIFKEWCFWQDYTLPEEKEKFFSYELRRLFKTHAVATSSISTLRSYLGNKVKIVKPLPYKVSTSVTIEGTVLVNGKDIT